MILEKSTFEIYEIVENIYKSIKLENWQIKSLQQLIDKLTEKAADNILNNIFLTLHVQDIQEAVQSIHVNNIKKVDDEVYVCILYKLINKFDFHNSDIKVQIHLKKYSKYTSEINDIIHSLAFLIRNTDTQKSLSVNTKKIDELYNGNLTQFAKGAKKSLTATLIGKHKNDKFIVHPHTKYSIVSIQDLSDSYLHLKDKTITIKCPICKEKFIISEENIEKIINVQNNKIQVNCKHTKSKEHIASLPFSINLSNYFEDSTKKMDKIMFFINNFKKLTNVTQ
jgi:hypothetical protein